MPTHEEPGAGDQGQTGNSANRRMILMAVVVIFGVAAIVLLVLVSTNSSTPGDQTLGTPFSNIVKSL
jgi:hypothetical protein